MRLALLVNLLVIGFAVHLPTAAAATITVQSATYALKTAAPPNNPSKVCQSNPTSMTTQVATVCNGQGSCDYTVPLPTEAQDPAYGCFKSFQIRYACSNYPSVVYSVEDGGINSEAATKTLKLTCSQNGIVINKASYGENCKTNLTGNRTLLVMNQCQGNSTCNYTVSSTKNGDPAEYCPKTFDVQYQCIGSSAQQKSAHIAAEADTQSVNLNCSSTAPTPPAALTINGVNVFVYTNYRTTDNTLFSVNSKFTVTNDTATVTTAQTISVDIYAVNTNVVTDTTPKTKIGDVSVTLPALNPGQSYTWKANTSYVANNIGRMVTRTSPSPQANYYTFVLIRDQAINTGGISIQTNQLPPAAMMGN